MREIFASVLCFVGLGQAASIDCARLDREAAVEAAHVIAYMALIEMEPIPPREIPVQLEDEPPVAPVDIPEASGPIGWTVDKMLSVIVRGFDIWLEKRGYSGEMDRVVKNAERLNNALDAFAAKQEAAPLTDVDLQELSDEFDRLGIPQLEEKPRCVNRIVVLTAKWCVHCKPELAALDAFRDAGYLISDKPDGHFWVLDVDKDESANAKKVIAQVVNAKGDYSIPKILVVDTKCFVVGRIATLRTATGRDAAVAAMLGKP